MRPRPLHRRSSQSFSLVAAALGEMSRTTIPAILANPKQTRPIGDANATKSGGGGACSAWTNSGDAKMRKRSKDDKRHGVDETERARLGGKLLLESRGELWRPRESGGGRSRCGSAKNGQGSSKQRGVLSAVGLRGSGEKGRPRRGKRGRPNLEEEERRVQKKSKPNEKLAWRKKIGCCRKDLLRKRESAKSAGSEKIRNEENKKNERTGNGERARRERIAS